MRGFERAVTTTLIIGGLFCAVAGWAFIEFLIWAFSHISFNFQVV